MFCKIVLLPSNEIHKLPTVPKSYEDLNGLTLNKFKGKIPEKFAFKYQDTDDELISLANEEDFKTALLSCESENIKTIKFYVVPETEQPITNPIYFPQNLSQLSQGAFYNNQSYVNNIANPQLLVPHSYSQGFEKKLSQGSEGYGGFGDADLSRFIDHHQGGVERNEKLKSDEEELDPEIQELPQNERQFSFAPFNHDQMTVISNLLDKKLKEKVENQSHVQTVVNEIMTKLNEELKNKTVKKQQSQYTYTPFMSKSVLSTSGRSSVQSQKEVQENEACSQCRKRIENIKYSCPTCSNKNFCEACEAKGEHPHPLLKTRLQNKALVSQTSGGNLSVLNNKSQSIGVKNLSEDKSLGNKSLKYSTSMTNIQFPASHFSRNSIPLSQSLIYGKGETPSGTPFEKEVKKYRVTLTKPPIYDVINVKPGFLYHVEFTLKNSGTEDWPENIKLICIDGIHKGYEEGIPRLAAGQVFTVKIDLKAPEMLGMHLSQWRLQYKEEDTPKLFGSNLYIEINVREEKKSPMKHKSLVPNQVSQVEKVKELQNYGKEGKGPASEVRKNEKNSEKAKGEVEKQGGNKNQEFTGKEELTQEERRLMKEENCSEQVLEFAKQLHNLHPSYSLGSQIKYIQESPINLGIDQLAELYLASVERGVESM